MASNKLKSYIGYNPTNVSSFSEKEKRAAYGKLRAIANKRLEKLERYGYQDNESYKTITGMFKSSRVPKLKDLGRRDLDQALTEVSYFLRGLSNIQKIHAYENKQIATLRAHGITGVNRSNLKKFGEFMEAVRQRSTARSRDSMRAVAIFEAAERLHMNPNVLLRNMEDYNTELEVWKKVKPFKSTRNGYSAYNYRKRYREALMEED